MNAYDLRSHVYAKTRNKNADNWTISQKIYMQSKNMENTYV